MSDHADSDVEEFGSKTPFWKQPKKLVLLGGVAAVLLYMAFSPTKPPQEKEEEAKPRQGFIGAIVPYTPPASPASAPAKEPPPPQTRSLPPPQPQAQAQPMIIPPMPNVSSPMMPGQTKAPRPMMLSFATPPATPSTPPKTNGNDNQAAAQTHIAFKGGEIPGAKASAAIDDTLILMPGLLPVVLDTAIDSGIPGPIAGHLPGPVYSAKGVLLMEAGTRVMGKYESISGIGQQRLQAVSAYAVTQNGIWVPLVEPFADDLGRNGLPGTIDNRYAERFGAAALLTLSESAFSALQASLSKGGNTYLSFSSGGGGGGGIGSLIQEILRANANIKPIFKKNQGETMALWIQSPVDFSASYKVRTR